MANAFQNFLKSGVLDNATLRDYQHASKLYLTNYYELTPKAGWIYYVELIINPKVARDIENVFDNENVDEVGTVREKNRFLGWYNKYQNKVGLLAKQVSMPKFNIATETLNQYNRKTVIQKTINYTLMGITFHDDMANATTNLWKIYFQYYYGDSLGSQKFNTKTIASPKYQNTKYEPFKDTLDYRYGLNNHQDEPFFISIDVYQLYQQRYTSFKIVNPLIREWKHDDLDQSQGNRLLTNNMSFDYETVIYNTDNTNYVKDDQGQDNVGFINEYYDNTPSPILASIKKSPDGARSVFGSLDIVPPTTGRRAERSRSPLRVSSDFRSTLSSTETNTKNRTIVSESLNQSNNNTNPVGLNVPLGTQSTSDQTSASEVQLGKPRP